MRMLTVKLEGAWFHLCDRVALPFSVLPEPRHLTHTLTYGSSTLFVNTVSVRQST